MQRVFGSKAFEKKRQAASAFLLVLLLSLQALVTFPSLHAWVHPDAGDPDHECAVTLFSHGQVDASAAVPPIFYAPQQVTFSEVSPKVIFVSTDIRLLPSRGPPASLTPA